MKFIGSNVFLLLFTLLMPSILYANTISFTLVQNGVPTTFEMEPIRLFVNGDEMLDLPAQPVIYNGYTLVPAREVFEPLGAFVYWNNDTRGIYIVYRSALLMLQTDNIYATLGDTTIQMDVPVKNINNKTMIPARFVAEAFDFEVEWDDEIRGVYIWNNHNEEEQLEQNEPDQEQDDLPIIPDDPIWIIEEIDIEEISTEEITTEEITTDNIPSISSPTYEPIIVEGSIANIVGMDFPQTNITSVNILEDGSATYIQIHASSPISNVEHKILEGDRVVVDIINANMAVTQTTHNLDGVAGISTIRVGQFETDPVKITRIVLDLDKSVEYHLYLSQDRNILTISFEKNLITDITFHSDGINDFITIHGNTTPILLIQPLERIYNIEYSEIEDVEHLEIVTIEYPDATNIEYYEIYDILENFYKLIVDIPHSEIYEAINKDIEGVHVTSVVLEKFDEDMARVIITVNSPISHQVTFENGKAIIGLREPLHRNISFDMEEAQIVITRDPENILSSSTLQKTDDYLNLRYFIAFPGNFEHHFGEDSFYVNSNGIEKIDVRTSNGITYLAVHTHSILAPIITESERYIYIRFVHPREVYDKIVILDAGHGGHDPGAVRFGHRESDIVLAMTLMLYDMLQENPNIRAYATRLTDVFIPLPERASFANDLGDLFISLHLNSFTNPAVSGIETFYWLRDDDHYMDISSRDVAAIMQRQKLDALGFIDRGIKPGRFVVLTQTTMPAVLLEFGFMSNEAEMRILASYTHQRRAIEGIYDGILEVFETYVPRR